MRVEGWGLRVEGLGLGWNLPAETGNAVRLLAVPGVLGSISPGFKEAFLGRRMWVHDGKFPVYLWGLEFRVKGLGSMGFRV